MSAVIPCMIFHFLVGLERTVYTEPEMSPSVEVCAVVASESVRNAIRSGAPVTLMTVDGTAEGQ